MLQMRDPVGYAVVIITAARLFLVSIFIDYLLVVVKFKNVIYSKVIAQNSDIKTEIN